MATKKKATSVAQKSKATKAADKKVVSAKKAAPSKKETSSKKTNVKKAAAKNANSNTKAKKAAPVKKAASKLSKKETSQNTIKKQSPVKKAAKTDVKKAVNKKLATPKKNAVTKQEAPAKKAAKKEAINTKKTKSVKQTDDAKPIKQNSSEKSVAANAHKAELKKAVAKVKEKKEEDKKPQKVFVMPKTNTEKARKYEPEFTKSVLDQSPAENNGPTMRYSDNELLEFRELITRKLETAKKELGYLQGLITRKDQMGGDESDNRYMTMEDGSLSMEREQLSQMASRQITFIDHLEKAMMRIENKTYGICRVTGKLIDKARLRAVPHATLSIEAKMGIGR